MIYSKTTLLILNTALVICSSSCKNEKKNKHSLIIKKEAEDLIVNQNKKKKLNSKELYHYSSANNQKFDRHVTGYDENGANVNGIINLEDEIAIGVLKGNEDGDGDIEIISDQINANKIIATDINGFKYKLKME